MTKKNLIVALRIRPLSQKEETAAAGKPLSKIAKAIDDKTVMVYDPTEYFSGSRPREKIFEFDHVFGEKEAQEKIFSTCVKHQVDAVMNGFNATVFAYGATGAGKTYTMMGIEDNPGVMSRTLDDLFAKISNVKNNASGMYKVSISYLEIYNEKIRDLLTGKHDTLELQEDPIKGVVVAGITYMSAANPAAILELLRKGNKNRIQEATGQNETSSRSHAILQIYVAFRSKEGGSHSRFAKLSLCDLAGSERAAETNNRGMRMIEGANINRSLLALGNCINSLIDPCKKDYINYRDSKLTRLLKDSLGGNCQTVMIANISPSINNFDETMNTLKYASRARNIKTKVVQQSESAMKHLQEFQGEFMKIKGESVSSLARTASVESISVTTKPPIKKNPSYQNNNPSLPINTNYNDSKTATGELQEALQALFVKQLEIRASELDHEEFDSSHQRKQQRLKFEIEKLETQINCTKNESRKKNIRSKIQRIQQELSRIQSLITKNVMAKQALSKDTQAINQKIMKLQENSLKIKEGHFSQYIKSEIKLHHMEMSSLGLEIKNALNQKLNRQKDVQITRMHEILNQYQKISAIQKHIINENNIDIPQRLSQVEKELQKCIKMYNEETSTNFLDANYDLKDRYLVKDTSKVSISLGKIASGLSKLLTGSKPSPQNSFLLDQRPGVLQKDSSASSLKISMVPSSEIDGYKKAVLPAISSQSTLDSFSTPISAAPLFNVKKGPLKKDISRQTM